MQDAILRRVWDFDVKERGYTNLSAGQDYAYSGIAVFFRKWHSCSGIRQKWNIADEEHSSCWITHDYLSCHCSGLF